MEFWGVEVKPGESAKVDELEVLSAYIHISQVALGEAKKEKSSESVALYLKVGEQKIVLGTLNRDEIPQISLDMVLHTEFALSHNSKNASVYFCGYRFHNYGTNQDETSGSSDDFSDFSESDDDGALTYQDNGKPETKAEKEKATESKKALIGASAKQAKIADPKKDEEDESDDDDDDDDDEFDDEDESGSPDEIDANNGSDEDEGDEDEDDEEEETPAKKVDQGTKRPNKSASKTPVPAKKGKNATPEKTDGKKNAHTATPHPMKKGGKTPNSAAKDQFPNSGGQLSCKSCNKYEFKKG